MKDAAVHEYHWFCHYSDCWVCQKERANRARRVAVARVVTPPWWARLHRALAHLVGGE